MERRGGCSLSRFEALSAWASFAISGGREAQPVEPVALAGDGDDESRAFRIGLDFSPQFPDQNVDAAVERLETPLGEGVQQSVAADHPSGPGDEHPQQSELSACQRDRLAGLARERAGVKIEYEGSKTQRRVRGPRKRLVQTLWSTRFNQHARRSISISGITAISRILQDDYSHNIPRLHTSSILPANRSASGAMGGR